MATQQIAAAKQNGSSVDVYDENGHYLFSRSGILIGFTSTTVAIREGNYINVYASDGSFKFSR